MAFLALGPFMSLSYPYGGYISRRQLCISAQQYHTLDLRTRTIRETAGDSLYMALITALGWCIRRLWSRQRSHDYLGYTTTLKASPVPRFNAVPSSLRISGRNVSTRPSRWQPRPPSPSFHSPPLASSGPASCPARRPPWPLHSAGDVIGWCTCLRRRDGEWTFQR